MSNIYLVLQHCPLKLFKTSQSPQKSMKVTKKAFEIWENLLWLPTADAELAPR